MKETGQNERSGTSSLLGESQRVLNQQVNIVQNQQAQATKIIRVALTIAGLLLTFVSISATVAINSGPDSNIPLLANLELSIGSAAIGIILFYILVAVFGAFAIIFVSAFRVLAPDSSEPSLLQIRPATPNQLLVDIFRMYDKMIPFITISVGQPERESYSLRPGLDGGAVTEILNSGSEINDVIEYNAGCIVGNEVLIDTNRRLLSNIYTTAIIITVGFILLFIMGAIYVVISTG